MNTEIEALRDRVAALESHAVTQDVVIVVLGVVLVGAVVAATIALQRAARATQRLGALEDEVGVAWAENRLKDSLIRRVMTIEITRALRARR